MTEYHPIYGELLTSRQVHDLTGFTLNQLRNFRQRPETSPFGFVRQGGTSWYRKDDIDAWLEINGTINFEYVAPEGAISTPLRSTVTDTKKREDLKKIASIITNNAWGSKATWLLEQSGLQNPYKQIDIWAEELWALHTGLPSADNGWKMLAKARTEDPAMYWQCTVWAVRKGYAEINKWDVTDQEIIEIPVGDVPPLKIT